MIIYQILINSTNTLPELPDYIKFCQSQIKKLYPNFDYHLYFGQEIIYDEILNIYENIKEDMKNILV